MGSIRGGIFWSAFAAVLLGSTMALSPTPAEAQSRHQQSRPAKAPLFTPLPDYVDGPMIAIVSIKSQRVYLFGQNGLIASAAVSTGQRGHETPEGVFSVIQKEEDHRSNIYDDASMPFMQRITWSGVALHAGALPGYPASHGCIRLPHQFAENLFKITKLNMRVIITPTDTAPMSVAHPALFQPRMTYVERPAQPGSGAPAATEAPSATPRAPLRSDDGEVMMLGGRLPKPDAGANPVKPQTAALTPAEAASARKVELVSLAATATKAADDARLTARTKQLDGQKLEKAARIAEAKQKQAEQKLAWIERALAAAKTDDQREKISAQKAKLVEELATLTKTAAETKASATQTVAEAKAALEQIKSLEAAKNSAQAEAKKAARLDNPVSVFVSLATKRVYIRQGREEVMSMPVTIKDPGKPIGTHVFTAISGSDRGMKLSWNVVNVASAVHPQPLLQTVANRGRGKAAEPAHAAPALPMPDVQGIAALERIEFPQEIRDRVEPYLLVGSSLIISDLPPSFETGNGTDFIVQTKGEEEARESVRRFIEEQRGERAERRRSTREAEDRRSRNKYTSSGWSWFD